MSQSFQLKTPTSSATLSKSISGSFSLVEVAILKWTITESNDGLILSVNDTKLSSNLICSLHDGQGLIQGVLGTLGQALTNTLLNGLSLSLESQADKKVKKDKKDNKRLRGGVNKVSKGRKHEFVKDNTISNLILECH